MLLLSNTQGGLSLPQEFGSALLALMPPPMFAFLHQFIGENAKYDFFLLVLVGQCAVFALAGALFNRYTNRQNAPLRSYQGLVLALGLWLFTGLVLLPLSGSGIFGANLTVGVDGGMLSLAVVGLTFGALFIFAQRWLVASTRTHAEEAAAAEDEGSVHPTRRVLLKQGAVALGAVAVGLGLWKFIIQGPGRVARVPVASLLQGYRSRIIPPPVPAYGSLQPAPLFSSEVTPNDQYYVVSKNFTDPTVSEHEWSLQVTGLVEEPYTLSYQELLALPMQQQYESMECISNEVGGSYMSNALWEGVRLADLLAKAGVRPGASKIVLHAYDNYADSIHLSKALEPTTLVAVHMNNTTLPDGHGYPARVLVPGIYGMKHVKWLTRIEVVAYDFQGYWQQRGWSDAAPVRLNARIDTPLDGSQVHAHRPTYVAGVAFSGNLGISEVDVSLNGGKTWQVATLKRPLSPWTWVLWEIPWVPEPGNFTVVVRAIDMQGNVQSPQEQPTLPNGASGYHTIGVSAS
jgi:DMSO/TMAO reductase YedYZ molybdopterin-dependent catalytic subunit